MATGWATNMLPRSRVDMPKREWGIAIPNDDNAPESPASSGEVQTVVAGKKKPGNWAPKPGPPRLGPNPMRRLHARQEPSQWKQPKQRLAFDADKENATRVKARFGFGVSEPGADPKAAGKTGAAKGAAATAKPRATKKQPPAKQPPQQTKKQTQKQQQKKKQDAV